MKTKKGPCAKQTVRCTIYAKSGNIFIGENWCFNPQERCPREIGEGYEKCKTICDQQGHAEVVALTVAGEEAKGGIAILKGHTYACQNCQESLFAKGIMFFGIDKC